MSDNNREEATVTRVIAQCPRCDTSVPVISTAMLVTATPDTSDERVAGAVTWLCAGCDDLVSQPISWPAMLQLVRIGVQLVEEDETDPRPVHPDHPADGAPLTADDVLELHELLSTTNWFDGLESPSPLKGTAP